MIQYAHNKLNNTLNDKIQALKFSSWIKDKGWKYYHYQIKVVEEYLKNKDILNKGLSIRLFNKREQKHFWHPIFCKGQTWPTENPFKLILQASKSNQKIFEIIIGETKKEREYDVIFENGLPKLSEFQSEEEIIKWANKPLKIVLKNTSNIGEDNLTLFFKITKKADLLVNCFDIKDEFLGEYNLGNIF